MGHLDLAISGEAGGRDQLQTALCEDLVRGGWVRRARGGGEGGSGGALQQRGASRLRAQAAASSAGQREAAEGSVPQAASFSMSCESRVE
mmetsp:Transcript_15801/g.44217  ORF Transcript_15801/g.44217 Transcript_15801/m.44217 type:complete len:90 (-) Transcript_15801:1346-1615(-)